MQKFSVVSSDWESVLSMWQVQCSACGKLVRLYFTRGQAGSIAGNEGTRRHQGMWTRLSLPGHGMLRPKQSTCGNITMQQSWYL